METLGDLGPLDLEHPEGSYLLTPASLIGIETVRSSAWRLAGRGIDWGCGGGCMSIAAARIAAVDHVTGLDIEPANVHAARRNAVRNGVTDKVEFLHSDSFTPIDPTDTTRLSRHKGSLSFIIANPPASRNDDGFGFRREVLRGGREYLKPLAVALLCISIQYSEERIRGLCDDVPGYRYEELVASTDWVQFDMNRTDLSLQVVEYAEEEERGGIDYHFRDPTSPTERIVTARKALALYRETGLSPLSKWQSYSFVLEP